MEPIIFGIVVLIILFLVLFTYFIPVGLWITAYFSGVRVGIGSLIGMRLRKVPPGQIIRPLIAATKAGLTLNTNLLEGHYMAGGKVDRVVDALISANKADIELKFEKATAIDLAGRNVLDAVKTSVFPKVIDCPDSTKGKSTIDAVAMDGIQLKAKARVTVRANLERLVGGAVEAAQARRVCLVRGLEDEAVVRGLGLPALLDHLGHRSAQAVEPAVVDDALEDEIACLEEGLALRLGKHARRMGEDLFRCHGRISKE